MSVIYRSMSDAASDLRRWSHCLPHEFSAVAGVPRSGTLVAAMLAEEMHIPLLPIEALMGKCSEPYRPPVSRKLHDLSGHPVLCLDDTSYGGKTMRRVQEHISRKDVVYAALYATDKAINEKAVTLRGYRLESIFHTFEWNLLRDYISKYTLVDLDGVLCEDWGKPDDGPEWLPKYEHFLENVRPLRKPWRAPLGIVTARLEKYRPQTEAWLKKHWIPYGQLLMSPHQTTRERSKNDGFVGHKVKQYLAMAGTAKLFIESERWQAEEIAKRTKMPVLCFTDHKLFNGTEPEAMF